MATRQRLPKLIEVENSDSRVLFVEPSDWTEADWPIRFAVRVEFTGYHSEEWERECGKYHVSVLAVATSAPSPMTLAKYLSTLGMTPEEFRALDSVGQVAVCIDVGLCATLHQDTGNNFGKLLRTARKELATLKSFTFGFAMDRAVNAIGNTGWDWIRGRIGYRREQDDADTEE